MSLAGFDFQALNRRYLAQPSNDAANYAVSIVSAGPGTAWRCIGAYHLTPAQNNGRHNVFVEVLDEAGNRTRQPQIAWTWWIDAPVQLRKLDKPNGEPAADIPIDKGATITLRVADAFPSDSVGNIHTRWADESTGNSIGHHSFFVCFQLQRRSIITPPIDPPTVPLTLERRVARLERLWEEMQSGK